VSNNVPEIPQVEQPAQAPSKPQLRAYPIFLYRMLVYSALALAGGALSDTSKSNKAPDERSPKEICRSYLEYRPEAIGQKRGTPSEALVDSFTNTTLCVLNQMCHPAGDSYTGKGKKECKRESKDFFMDQHDSSDPQKYIYWPNLHDYVHEGRLGLIISTLNQIRGDEDTIDTIQWFLTKFETYKSSHPSADGVIDTKAEEEAVFKAFVDDFVSAPLECVRDTRGACIQTLDGTDCYLWADLAHEVTLVNAEMEADGVGKLEPVVCLRIAVQQAAAYVDVGNQGCKVVGSHPDGKMVNLPGNSNHIGGAIDLKNWGVAEPYMSGIGMGCAKVEGDKGHCTFAEGGAPQKRLKSVRLKIKELGKGAKKFWRALTTGWKENQEND
jgi:hypothetical protein